VASIAAWTVLAPGDEVAVGGDRVTLAFDGEREVVLQPGQEARVRFDTAGPRLLDAPGLVWAAAGDGTLSTAGLERSMDQAATTQKRRRDADQ
jgi:hypothetical protein